MLKPREVIGVRMSIQAWRLRRLELRTLCACRRERYYRVAASVLPVRIASW